MDICDKHKQYKGVKAPDYECEKCLSIYVKVGSQRPIRIMYRKASIRHKDKSKYDRKQKGDE
jgi:hypothetical protein